MKDFLSRIQARLIVLFWWIVSVLRAFYDASRDALKRFAAWVVSETKRIWAWVVSKVKKEEVREKEIISPSPEPMFFTFASGTTWISFPSYGMPLMAFPDEGFVLRLGGTPTPPTSSRRRRATFEHYYYTGG